MEKSHQVNPSHSYVDAILYNFLEDHLSSTFRAKALAIMSILCREPGGYGKPTNFTATNVADLLNTSNSAISQAIKQLVSANMIHRSPTTGRGNRLVITPLGPELWRLPNGRRFRPSKTQMGQLREEKSDFVHQKEPISEDELTQKKNYNSNFIQTESPFQYKWQPLFFKIWDYIRSAENITAYEPSKLITIMSVIAEYSEGPGHPCSLSAGQIAEEIKSNPASMIKPMALLESIGVIKRKRILRKKIITPILPDPAPVDCSDEPKETSK